MNIWDIFGIYLEATEMYWILGGWHDGISRISHDSMISLFPKSFSLSPARSDQVEACAVPKVWSSGKKMSWLSYGYTLGIPGVNIQKDVENLWLPQEKWCINAGFSTVMSWLSHAFVLEKMFPAVYRPNWDSKCNPRHRWGKSSAKKEPFTGQNALLCN